MIEPEAHAAGRPKLARLIIKNFRAIGSRAVEVELDDIVILVGPNNSGKSSILSAYEIIMNDGSKESYLSQEDFPNGEVNADALPEIELHTIVTEDTPGEEWCAELGDGTKLIREKWTWAAPGPPKRVGFNVELDRWAEHGDGELVPWGAPGVANARRPQPHRVNAFDPPTAQTEEIIRLLDAVLDEKLKQRLEESDDGAGLEELQTRIKDIQATVVDESEESIKELQESLSELVGTVFPRHKVEFDPRPADVAADVFSFFSAASQLRMGPEDGYLSDIEKQGSGARRTLLWTALKLLADQGYRARPAGSKRKTPITVDKNRPHLLLIDEPEICLHPSAIREACSLLYDLPGAGRWQVVVTTHSPCFVDFSRDNTTIVRVQIEDDGHVSGTSIFRPTAAQLDDDDRRRLKLLNLCDPYVAEFFFGGRSIIVEGDTEHTAFAYVREIAPQEFKGVHVIRARGKATVVSLMKILNHFGAPYGVLHDTDTPVARRRDGTPMANPAWSKNADIIAEAATAPSHVRLLASVPNFDVAFLGTELSGEKPYEALRTLREDEERLERVRNLLWYLIGESDDIPDGTVRMTSQDELDAMRRDLTTAGQRS